MQPIATAMVKIQDLSKYYVYSIHDSKGRCMYVNYGKWMDALSMAKVRGNPVVDPEQTYQVVLHSAHDKEGDAYNQIGKIVKMYCPTYSPPWQYTTSMNRYIKVQCDQTGEVYNSASHACQTLGIPQSRMSQHLSRRPGYKTIKGMTFSYYKHYDMEKMLAKVGIEL